MSTIKDKKVIEGVGYVLVRHTLESGPVEYHEIQYKTSREKAPLACWIFYSKDSADDVVWFLEASSENRYMALLLASGQNEV